MIPLARHEDILICIPARGRNPKDFRFSRRGVFLATERRVQNHRIHRLRRNVLESIVLGRLDSLRLDRFKPTRVQFIAERILRRNEKHSIPGGGIVDLLVRLDANDGRGGIGQGGRR